MGYSFQELSICVSKHVRKPESEIMKLLSAVGKHCGNRVYTSHATVHTGLFFSLGFFFVLFTWDVNDCTPCELKDTHPGIFIVEKL